MNFQIHTISWNITKRCNLLCDHCYLDADYRFGRKVDELTTQDCFNTIEQIAELNSNALLILTGGEPLLRSDVFDISRYAAERGFFVVIATNGTTVTPNNARRIVDAGIKGVSLSLHSTNDLMHDRFTSVPGSWKAAVDAINNLRKNKLEFVIQTSVMSWNYEEIPEIIDLSYSLGAKFFNLYFLVCTGRGQRMTDVTPDQYESMLTQIYQIQKKYVGKMLISAKCSPQYKRVVYEANPDSPLLKSYSGGCPAATHYCQIDPTGEVNPCPYLPSNVGNVRKTPFARIWREASVLNELRDRSRLKGRCGICEFKSICSGCRARAFAETQDYLDEDPSCIYEPGKYDFKEIILTEKDTLGIEITYRLPWEEEAQKRLLKIPSFARGMVVKGVELFAENHRYPEVTVEIMKEARKAVIEKGTMVPFLQKER